MNRMSTSFGLFLSNFQQPVRRLLAVTVRCGHPLHWFIIESHHVSMRGPPPRSCYKEACLQWPSHGRRAPRMSKICPMATQEVFTVTQL